MASRLGLWAGETVAGGFGHTICRGALKAAAQLQGDVAVDGPVQRLRQQLRQVAGGELPELCRKWVTGSTGGLSPLPTSMERSPESQQEVLLDLIPELPEALRLP